MKVIRVDNYDRELYADKLIKENLSEESANVLAASLNVNDNDPWYYRVVHDDYKLFEGFEP